MNYRDYNDFELVYEIRESSDDAYNILVQKYEPLINKLAREYYTKFKKIKVEYEDLVQEGYFGLFQALGDYDEKTCLFYTYAVICIRREMERLVKSFSRNKQMVLNNAVSINRPIDSSGELFLEDVISTGDSIENELIYDFNCQSIMDLKYDMPLEMSLIFELKANKFTNMEISRLLDLPKKRVEKNINKIRQIVRKHYRTIK